jgi:hypothetical protein
MNRRTTLLLTGMVLLGVDFTAQHGASFAQSDPFVGTWQLNIAKSKFTPGPPPRNQTLSVQGDGQDQTVTITGVGAEGNPIGIMFTIVFDGT